MSLFDFMDESSEMFMEASSDDNATTLKKTIKWYNNIKFKCRKKSSGHYGCGCN